MPSTVTNRPLIRNASCPRICVSFSRDDVNPLFWALPFSVAGTVVFVCGDINNILTLFLDPPPNFASKNTPSFLSSHLSRSVPRLFQPPAPDLRHGSLLGYYIGYKATNSAEPFRYQTLEVNATTSAIVDFASLVSKHACEISAQYRVHHQVSS